MLQTESPSSAHPDLDLYALPDLLSAFIEDQDNAINAVRTAAPQLAQAVAAALPRMQRGGRAADLRRCRHIGAAGLAGQRRVAPDLLLAA